jgi:hypothetical protein
VNGRVSEEPFTSHRDLVSTGRALRQLSDALRWTGHGLESGSQDTGVLSMSTRYRKVGAATPPFQGRMRRRVIRCATCIAHESGPCPRPKRQNAVRFFRAKIYARLKSNVMSILSNLAARKWLKIFFARNKRCAEDDDWKRHSQILLCRKFIRNTDNY